MTAYLKTSVKEQLQKNFTIKEEKNRALFKQDNSVKIDFPRKNDQKQQSSIVKYAEQTTWVREDDSRQLNSGESNHQTAKTTVRYR